MKKMTTVIAPPRTIHYVTTSGSGCVMYNINDPQEELILRREESGWGAFELEERTSSGGEKWLVIPGTTWGRPELRWWNGIGVSIAKITLDSPVLIPRS